MINLNILVHALLKIHMHFSTKVTTDTNYHNSCMTKHNFPYNFNICYRIYLKPAEINEIGIPDANILQ